jgi:hypothetical protein
MNKKILVTAILLGLSVSSAKAITIDITSSSVSGAPLSASGIISTDTIGDTLSTGDFFNYPWIASTLVIFDTVGSHDWAGSSLQGDYDYNFTLTTDQYAFGTSVEWGVNFDIPLLLIFDCSDGINCYGLQG